MQPLSLGELLDRAVTLIVRRLALWLGLFAAVALPLALCSHVDARVLARASDAIATGGAVKMPATLFDFVTRNRFAAIDVVPLELVQIVLIVVGYPLVIASTIYLIDRACEAEPLALRAALDRGIRRLLSLYAVVLLWSFASSLASTAVSLALVGAGRIASVLPNGNDFLDWAGIVFWAIVMLLLAFGALPILVMLCAVAICYAVVETQNPLLALRRAFVRVVRKGEIVRAMIVGDIVLVVAATATGIAAGFGEPLDELARVPIGSAALGLLGSIVASVVCCAFAVLYARDARMRRDGGDLVYAMRAAASPAETVPGRSTAR